MSDRMTWEQKFAALNALAECSLMMRKPGNWYVRDQMEIARNGMLESPTQAASDPALAVEACWDQFVTNLSPSAHVFVYSKNLRVRWNGFMWVDVPSGSAQGVRE